MTGFKRKYPAILNIPKIEATIAINTAVLNKLPTVIFKNIEDIVAERSNAPVMKPTIYIKIFNPIKDLFLLCPKSAEIFERKIDIKKGFKEDVE